MKSSDANKISTTNLLLASLLISSGGNVTELEDKGRYTLVHLDMSGCSVDFLKSQSGTTLELLGQLSKGSDTYEWERFFSVSIWGKVDREYKELKKLISETKSKSRAQVA